MNDLDSAAAGAFERSAIVRRVERLASVLRSSTTDSRVIAAATSWTRAVRPFAGQVLLTAAITHLVLALAVTRPPTWHFAILPSIFLMAGAVLIAASTRTR